MTTAKTTTTKIKILYSLEYEGKPFDIFEDLEEAKAEYNRLNRRYLRGLYKAPCVCTELHPDGTQIVWGDIMMD